MTRRLISRALAVAVATSLPMLLPCPHFSSVRAADKPTAASTADWNRKAAASYLDSREIWWQSWDRAQKDHGTLCISCHTQASYGMARPALRGELSETGPSPSEQIMLASIEKRVRAWKDMQPFYSDAVYGAGKEIESRDAESVLNAVILSSYDQHQEHMSEATRIAFNNAWALQSKTGPDAGSWVWQNFDYTPWESKESQYHWAALMAFTVAKSPGDYRREPANVANINLLLAYLRTHYDAQPLLNKIVALRAAAAYPDLLTKSQRSALLRNLYTLQRPDGGWSLTDLGTWQRRDKTPLETRSDGYATGLIVLTLEESTAKPRSNPHISRGLAWLVANQDKSTGAWPAWSLNKNRDPKSNVGQFMSDAATSYAVLALEARH